MIKHLQENKSKIQSLLTISFIDGYPTLEFVGQWGDACISAVELQRYLLLGEDE